MEAGNRIIEENIIQTDKKNIEMEDLELTKEWDKIFPKSYKVNHSRPCRPWRSCSTGRSC